MSVVYPLARGLAPVLTSIAALLAIGESLTAGQLLAVGLVSLGIMTLSLGTGASGAAVGFALATGVSVASYSFLGGIGVRSAGSVLGFLACLEIVTGVGMVGYALLFRRRDLLPYARRHGRTGLLAGAPLGAGISRLPAGRQSLAARAGDGGAREQRAVRRLDRHGGPEGGLRRAPGRRGGIGRVGHRDAGGLALR
jgi:hypothetical protein